MKIKDGGPAFPNIAEKVGYYMPGMTLRQWYAAMALSSMNYTHDYSSGPCNSGIAKRAFEIADAMIAHEENELKSTEEKRG